MSALQLLLLFSTSVAGSGLNFHFPTGNSEPVPFEVEVDPAFIEQTILKASLYRPSIDLLDDSNSDWIEGPPQANMTALADYWANKYDWFETQEIINGNASHYAITIPSVSAEYDHEIHLHLVHEVSAAEDAIPLLLLHGWPSTHLEWSKIIGPLVTPADAGAPSFHIVAPDLPGFGFSPAPSHSGLGPNQTAMVIDKLMHQLGYEKYGIVSTDVGWSVAMAMTDVVADSLLGHFTDFFTVPPNATDLERLAQNLTTPEEAAYIISISAFGTEHSGYSSVQAVSPLAIGQALTDSPVGFAGWVWHLMHGISDGYDYSFEELITHTMMLWIQGTYGNLRWYREFPGLANVGLPVSDVPTGVTQWGLSNGPFESLRNANYVPREWIERTANLVYLTRHDEGGHFPAINLPGIYVEEVRTFFSSLDISCSHLAEDSCERASG